MLHGNCYFIQRKESLGGKNQINAPNLDRLWIFHQILRNSVKKVTVLSARGIMKWLIHCVNVGSLAA